MTLSPHASSTFAALLRLGAAWMVAILLVQGNAAALALGIGPSHRHVDTAAPSAVLLHGHWHEVAQRHYHLPDDTSIIAEGHDAIDLATAQIVLAWAFALFAATIGWRGRDMRLHAWPAKPLWTATTRVPAPLRRPPRG